MVLLLPPGQEMLQSKKLFTCHSTVYVPLEEAVLEVM